MNALLFLLLHLLAFSYPAPDPDNNLHLPLPPEGGQGDPFFFAFVKYLSFKGGNLTLVEALRLTLHMDGHHMDGHHMDGHHMDCHHVCKFTKSHFWFAKFILRC